MKNPIKEAREKLELSAKNFAIVAGTTEQTVRTNERGDNVVITPKLLTFLTDQGFNEDQLITDYKRYRAWKKNELLKTLKTKRA